MTIAAQIADLGKQIIQKANELDELSRDLAALTAIQAASAADQNHLVAATSDAAAQYAAALRKKQKTSRSARV